METPKIHEADYGHVIIPSSYRMTKLDEGDIEGSMEKLKQYNAGAFTYMGQNSEKGGSDESDNQMEEKLERKEEVAQDADSSNKESN